MKQRAGYFTLHSQLNSQLLPVLIKVSVSCELSTQKQIVYMMIKMLAQAKGPKEVKSSERFAVITTVKKISGQDVRDSPQSLCVDL